MSIFAKPRRQASRDLHRHLAMVLHYTRAVIRDYDPLERSKAEPQQEVQAQLSLAALDTEIFDYYYEKDKAFYFRLPGCFVMRRIYMQVKTLHDSEVPLSEKRDICISIRSELCCELNNALGFIKPTEMIQFGKEIFGTIEESYLKEDIEEYRPRPWPPSC